MTKKLKIAYIGNFEPEFSTENDIRKAFEYLGHEVIKLQENKSSMRDIRNAALSSDMLLITSTWDDALNLVSMIDIFHECAVHNIPTATVHLDIFWGTNRNCRTWWLNPMFNTAYIFTADGDHDLEWKNFGKNHIWLPPAVRHDAAHFGKPKKEYSCDVSFVGSNGRGYHEDVWPYRKILVNNLREMCIRNNWTFRNPGGDDPKVSRGEDMNDFYASCKVSVGDSLCLMKDKSKYWSDRVPEATARGAMLIMPNIDELQTIYEDSIVMYQWNNFKELEDKIKLLLNNPKKREKLVKKSQSISAKYHTYINRVQTIIEKVGLND